MWEGNAWLLVRPRRLTFATPETSKSWGPPFHLRPCTGRLTTQIPNMEWRTQRPARHNRALYLDPSAQASGRPSVDSRDQAPRLPAHSPQAGGPGTSFTRSAFDWSDRYPRISEQAPAALHRSRGAVGCRDGKRPRRLEFAGASWQASAGTKFPSKAASRSIANVDAAPAPAVPSVNLTRLIAA